MVNIDKIINNDLENNKKFVSTIWVALTKKRYSIIQVIDISNFRNTITQFETNRTEIICMCTVDEYHSETNFSSSLSQSHLNLAQNSTFTQESSDFNELNNSLISMKEMKCKMIF